MQSCDNDENIRNKSRVAPRLIKMYSKQKLGLSVSRSVDKCFRWLLRSIDQLISYRRLILCICKHKCNNNNNPVISSVFLCYLGWSLWPTTIHILLPGATNQHAKKWSHFLGSDVGLCQCAILCN